MIIKEMNILVHQNQILPSGIAFLIALKCYQMILHNNNNNNNCMIYFIIFSISDQKSKC